VLRLLNLFDPPDEELYAQAPLALNPDVPRPLKGLQVLFDRRLDGLTPDSKRLTAALKAYHPWLLYARCEMNCSNRDAPFGLAGWDDHVIKVVGFTQALPSDVTARCVRPAHYAPEYKREALAHQAHVQLYYAGFASSSLEQYVALAVVAAALCACGAVGVLNENARTSMPGAILAARDFAGDRLQMLRALPIPALYAGFVKHEIAGVSGVWMRTHGCELLGLPDLAFLASGHRDGERVFELFSAVLNHLLVTRDRLTDGDTMQLAGEWYLRARRPGSVESYLENDSELLILETIGPNAINL
jgi:hypothetical protein